jgi:hypothetical protein
LEFALDTIDHTPVMVYTDNTDPKNPKTTYYPGNSSTKPTYLTVFNNSVEITKPQNPLPPGTLYPCGVTTDNAWVLKDLANAASNQAAAVGALVANTWGGVSIPLGALPKISIGDNQTLSTIVKTAASRLALRLTLASVYKTLQYVRFDVSEPGGGSNNQ